MVGYDLGGPHRPPPSGAFRWPPTVQPRDSVWMSGVPGAGVEPARPFGQMVLSHPRLPFRHPGERQTLASPLHVPTRPGWLAARAQP